MTEEVKKEEFTEEFAEEPAEEPAEEKQPAVKAERQEVISVYYEAPPEDTEVIGIRFRTSGKVYFFDPDGVRYPEGCHAVVETARGQEYGLVAQSNHIVSGKEIVLPLRKAIRVATPEDDRHDKENIQKAEEAFLVGNKKIAEHQLDMKLIDCEYTFDNSKLLFYFTSDGRVDFRDLVKDLAGVFRCRIELRQMGIRDEAKVLGGLGTCGRPFCCHAFLPDFVQVSIKMAKEQNLSLNSAKISGACGRLMCCLRYEYDTYLEEGRRTPKVDSLVNTPDGIGVVVEAKPLVGLVKVRSLADDGAAAPKVYHRDDLSPIKKGDDNYEKALEEKTLEKVARAKGTTRAALKQAEKGETAGKKEKAVRQERPVRPAPPRAASYSDQVLPLALMPNTTEGKNASGGEQLSGIKGENETRTGRKDRSKNRHKAGKAVSETAKKEQSPAISGVPAEDITGAVAGETDAGAKSLLQQKGKGEQNGQREQLLQKEAREQRNRHRRGGARPEKPAESPAAERSAKEKVPAEHAPRYEKVSKSQQNGGQSGFQGKEITVNRKENGNAQSAPNSHPIQPVQNDGSGQNAPSGQTAQPGQNNQNGQSAQSAQKRPYSKRRPFYKRSKNEEK